MLNDILNALNPIPYADNALRFFFPYEAKDDEEDITLTKPEKDIIVKQINDVKSHLNSAKRHVEDRNFDEAIHEVEKAIDASTCSRCQRKMIVTGFEMNHADNVCLIDANNCVTITDHIVHDIDDFNDNYLPKVEEVLSAREV